MKKFLLPAAALILAGLLITGCATTETRNASSRVISADTGPEYYVAMFAAPVLLCNSLQKPEPPTKLNILNYINTLYDYSVEDVGFYTGLTRSDLYDYFTLQLETSAEYADNFINFVNAAGNNYAFIAYSEDYHIVFYCELE
ncbi:MAG: hypothetical protein FWC17_02470 [Treponema sp.]|nr:hypothetical protein [Treponema sp.]